MYDVCVCVYVCMWAVVRIWHMKSLDVDVKDTEE